MNYKAALFDLDGVVIDTESQYSVFWGSQCRLYHPEIPGLENKIKGQTLTQIFDGCRAISPVSNLSSHSVSMNLKRKWTMDILLVLNIL